MRTVTTLILILVVSSWAAAVTATSFIAYDRTVDLPRRRSSAVAPSASVTTLAAARGRVARVTKVVDGDTLDTTRGKVRLLSIDSPEVFFGVECGGPEASAKMHRLLPVGSRVRLVRDKGEPNRDRFGRKLRYVHHRRRGTNDIGRAMIRSGWAEVYLAFPTSRTASYLRDQRRAQRRHRGIWGLCR